MSEDPVLFRVEDGVAEIRLNRPAAGNTINMPLAQGLLQAAIRCDQDAAIRCVTLTGEGKLFCGGGDVAAMSAAGDQVPGLLSELAGVLHMAVARLMRMPKPLLVLVNGPAAGAGLSLAIFGDVVLAARSAHFTAAYGGVGLTPDGGLSWLLPRLVGLRKAQEMILRNQRVSAAEAEAMGLITRAVDDAELAAEGRKAAAELAASATAALGAARGLLLEGAASGLETQLEREARSLSASARTPECREGVGAFLAKRKPDFRGAI
jgi:2-(1,2-epoxy-1,2-dihydrophenyl)acetyl-CoA isomerase